MFGALSGLRCALWRPAPSAVAGWRDGGTRRRCAASRRTHWNHSVKEGSALKARDDLCVCEKKVKTKTKQGKTKTHPFYFSSENQRGYLTDFPFDRVIETKETKDLCFFSLSLSFSFVLFGLRSALRFCPPLHSVFPFIYHLVGRGRTDPGSAASPPSRLVGSEQKKWPEKTYSREK